MSARLPLLALTILTAPALAQVPILSPADAAVPAAATPSPIPSSGVCVWPQADAPAPASGTRGFSNFIGFMSNPIQNVDPRSLTQVWPVFLAGWTDPFGPLPDANFQVYGAGINLALTERLSVGLNQGGYQAIQTGSVGGGPITQVIAARRGLGNQTRTGFLNLGGFAQYTLVANEESQTLFTVGTRFEVPSGSTEVFQGRGPAYVSPYITFGQGLGNFHLLATAGYEFPARTGNTELRTFYCNAHLDYQLMDWIYPLVELNYARASGSTDVNLPLAGKFFELSNFEAVGEVLTMAVGVNFVLVRDRLELGGAWSTPLYTRRDFNFNSMIVKMIVRF